MARHSRNTMPRRDVTFASAKGPFFFDETGRQYVDLSSQTMNLLLGQSHPAVKAAILQALDKGIFATQDFRSPMHDVARDRLAALLPTHLDILNLRLNDGSSAIECAVKQARRARGRGRILTVKGIYLGQNTLSIHMRGLGERPMDLLKGGGEDVVFGPLPWPHPAIPFAEADAENGRALTRLVHEHQDELACVILDPVMISSGVFGGRNLRQLVLRVAEACAAVGVPLILDEIQTFGWVPDDTLSKHWGIPTDMMALGKGIGGGLPLAACATRDAFDNLDFADADYTNGGNFISIASLAVTCDVISAPEERSRFALLCEGMEAILAEGVARRQGTVATRGVGLIRCLELLADSQEQAVSLCQAVARLLLTRGIYVRTYGPCIGLKPPRVITLSDLEHSLNEVFLTIDEFAAGLHADLLSPPRADFSRLATSGRRSGFSDPSQHTSATQI